MWAFGHTTSSSDSSGSLLSNAIESFHCVNQLYDGTLNCFFTLATSAVASNETFTYKTAMQQDDYREFVKAMITELTDHEKQGHLDADGTQINTTRDQNNYEYLEF